STALFLSKRNPTLQASRVDRCPNTIFESVLSGPSAAGFYFYVISVNLQALLHVVDLVAATPSPTLSFDQVSKSAIPTIGEAYLPGALMDYIDNLISRRNWSMCRLLNFSGEGACSQTRVIEELEETPKKNVRVQELDDERIFDLRTYLSNSQTQTKEDMVHINKLEQELGIAKGELRIFNVKQRNMKVGELQDRISGSKGQLTPANTAQADAISKHESLAKEDPQALESKKLRDTNNQTAIDALKEEIKIKDSQMKALKAGSGAVDNISKTSTSAY
ncbi:MAG: hypothetical protein Q9180_007751, partial [Flavoplaca navasiana]